MELKMYLNIAIIAITLLVMFFTRKRPKKTKIIIDSSDVRTEADLGYQAKLKTIQQENYRRYFLVSFIIFLVLWAFALRNILTLENKMTFFVSTFGLGFFVIMRFFYSKTIATIIYLLLLVELICIFMFNVYYKQMEPMSVILFFIATTLMISSVDKKLLKKEKLFAPQN
jgi:hypothetical protein